ncbi:hypothetical protein N658DRAFT_17540 [Parathielavia hyrcaniae]|uniref:Uncharacterized protein n=1 Tax=Parathielavia hyrcaniae TaxID=113614 RepID=A0AAN6Q9Z8_9PEZI|nr:hypothetical protein N658DRAFT_17540 [Parathielavia hyrcaniae]
MLRIYHNRETNKPSVRRRDVWAWGSGRGWAPRIPRRREKLGSSWKGAPRSRGHAISCKRKENSRQSGTARRERACFVRDAVDGRFLCFLVRPPSRDREYLKPNSREPGESRSGGCVAVFTAKFRGLGQAKASQVQCRRPNDTVRMTRYLRATSMEHRNVWMGR